MPCDASRVWIPLTVEKFEKADFDLLYKAANAIGGTQVYVDVKNKVLQFRHNGSYVNVVNGQITVNKGQEATIKALSKEYGVQTVKSIPTKFKGLTLDVKGDQMTLKWR